MAEEKLSFFRELSQCYSKFNWLKLDFPWNPEPEGENKDILPLKNCEVEFDKNSAFCLGLFTYVIFFSNGIESLDVWEVIKSLRHVI